MRSCRTLLEINPRTNIVFLTAYADYSLDAWKTESSGFMLKLMTAENVHVQPDTVSYQVEQAQYEYSLFVDYDTPHKCFRVPALTLQPIVENAIKHGRDPYAGSFRISIRTRRTDSGSEIVAADNGRGFDTSDDKSEPHTVLKNIQQRLKITCNGSMTITPNVGGGTAVTVTIPTFDCCCHTDGLIVLVNFLNHAYHAYMRPER